MTLYNQIKQITVSLFAALLLLVNPLLNAKELGLNDCRALEISQRAAGETLEYSNALLWRVSKSNMPTSHIYGTIHVSDPDVTTLPDEVSTVLLDADVFTMEALPDDEQLLKFSEMMFFNDGTTLRDFLDEKLFERTAEILSDHQFTTEMVLFLKPWAAFLIMNYPPDDGLPLDFQLLNTAQENGARITALETLEEQGQIFGGMALESQLRLLLDSVCHYEVIEEDFEVMKSYYLDRNLNDLYVYSNQYTIANEKLYKDLVKRLLSDRNHTMVERMQDILKDGNAFIAIGAMHLPGPEGVLALLASKGFTITPVY